MEIIIHSDPAAASSHAARYFENTIRSIPEPVLGLATGSTPTRMYEELIRLHREEGLDFSKVRTFNLDEYVGLPATHPASYHHFMQENLFTRVNINPDATHIPNGSVSGAGVVQVCDDYEAAIREAGGIDLQVLGIGTDGHIGFNEPSSSLVSRTRIKTLTARTREDNARYFASPDDVPLHVITMGIGTVMEARTILLLAFGENKSAAVAAAVEGPITSNCPASILQMHPKTIFLLDEAAASRLHRADYYRWVYERKPEWQRI